MLFGGDGNDTFVWNPGDGSDVVEGQGGHDTLQFNGSNQNENMTLSANGSRVKLFRDVGNVTMDINGVEQVDIAAEGGADTITVNDLTGTGVTDVNIDLAGATPRGDGQADAVIVNGSAAADNLTISGAGDRVAVVGPSTTVQIDHAEAANDSLRVNGLAGDDTLDASGLHARVIALTLDGGDGNDVLIGSRGDDLLIGGRGADMLFGGPGNDTFVWNPGDGSDVVEGQGGHDTLQFNGSNQNENMTLSANGSRVKLFRDVGNVTMDVNGVEQVNIAAEGGADTITVNDLTGTGVTDVNIDLAGTPGSGTGDGAADTVIVNGTDGRDTIAIGGDAGSADVIGLAARVHISGAEPASDALIVNALGGDDLVNASGLSATAIQLTEDGGAGNDILIGGAGADTIRGGDGNDLLIGGPGQDNLDGGPGSNVVIQ
jgi:Ca2+-binding RTX toxin-like protein